MATINRTDITINGSNATYTFREEAPLEGTYTGSFIFRCYLLPSQKLAAARERRALLGEFGIAASDVEKQLALALSELKYRVVHAPPFWNQNQMLSGDIPDFKIIFNVFEAAMDAQTMFAESKAEEKQKLIDSSTKAAEALVEKRAAEAKEEEKKPKTEDEQLEDELKELDE